MLPGVAGGLCLLLAFFTFQVLPINYAGMLLILFGIALLILEVKVTSHGVLSVGGIASLFFGSMMLMDSTAPELQVSLSVILPVVAGPVGDPHHAGAPRAGGPAHAGRPPATPA